MYLEEIFAIADYDILEEGEHPSGAKFVRIEGKMQRANYVNANKRYYAGTLLGEGIKAMEAKTQNRGLMGELDHPFSRNPSRLMTVAYQQASHYIERLIMDGDYVIGKWQTANSPNGIILRNFFKDNATVGSSLRGGGKTADRGTHLEVVSPFRIITYDAVSNPSNHEATLRSVNEAFHEAVDICLLGGGEVLDMTDKKPAEKKELIERAKFDKQLLHDIVDDIVFDGFDLR